MFQVLARVRQPARARVPNACATVPNARAAVLGARHVRALVRQRRGAALGLFTECGLTPAFFKEMRLKADSLDGYAAPQGAGITEGVSADAALEEALRQADEAVERLNAVVRNKYRDNPARLAAWESASRLEHAPRSEPEDDDEPPQPPPADG